VNGLIKVVEKQSRKVHTAIHDSAREKILQAEKKNSRKRTKTSESKPVHPNSLPSPTSKTPEIEKKHVQNLYNAIADSWDRTRYKGWPRVDEFIDGLPKHSLLADLGCGNGKYMGRKNAVVIGCDISERLVEICRRKGFEAQVSDALRAPYRSNSFDGAISIAVLHHLSSKKRRIQALGEVIRVIKGGGHGLVYAWALDQGKCEGDVGARQFPSQDVYVPFHLRADYTDPAKHPDIEFNSEKKSFVFQRYCHVYKEGEIESLLLEAARGMGSGDDLISVQETYYDMSNWCVRFQKLRDS